MVHLMCYVLEPALYTLNALDHLGYLGTNDRLAIQRFAEGLSLSSPSVFRNQKNIMKTEKGDCTDLRHSSTIVR